MNLFLFIITLVISFVAVRAGAIAFQLTGMEWSLAKFQALSCFSGTGFTTREAELVTGHEKRRRIAGTLMVLGNAGLVTLVATFANSMRPGTPHMMAGMGIPAAAFSAMNLLVIVLVLYVVYKVFSGTRVGTRITSFLRAHLIKRERGRSVSIEELVVATGGYGVIEFAITKESAASNSALADSGLREKDITVLAIQRGKETIANPPAGEVLKPEDRLLCFGHLDQMRAKFA